MDGMFRVLKDDCRMGINIEDQVARSVYYGRYKVISIREEIIRFCECIGMDYIGAIIWQKQITMHIFCLPATPTIHQSLR